VESARREIWQHDNGSCYTVLVNPVTDSIIRAVGPYDYKDRNDGLQAIIPPNDNDLVIWINEQPEGSWKVLQP
jgi:hypothetical protein